MLDQNVTSHHSPQLDLLDIQENLDELVRQLTRRHGAAINPRTTAALLAAMSYKLNNVRHALNA
jgi:hypothetical protein